MYVTYIYLMLPIKRKNIYNIYIYLHTNIQYLLKLNIIVGYSHF